MVWSCCLRDNDLAEIAMISSCRAADASKLDTVGCSGILLTGTCRLCCANIGYVHVPSARLCGQPYSHSHP